MRSTRHAFTLVELLVVMVMIAILAAILLPAISGAKESARRAFCASNLRQIILAALIYTEEHDDTFPAQPGGDGLAVRAIGGNGTNYYDLLMPYMKHTRVWLCPSARVSSVFT